MCVGLSVCIYVCVRCAYACVLLRVFFMYFCFHVGMSVHALIYVCVSVTTALVPIVGCAADLRPLHEESSDSP